MGTMISTILDTKPFGVPVGSALLLTAAFGLSDGFATLIDSLVSRVLPAGTPGLPLLVNGALAWTVSNVKAIENFLTPELAELVSVAALTSGANQTLNITGMVRGLVNQLTSLIPGIGPSVPVLAPSTPTPEPMSGYSMGNPSIAMGQVSEAQNIDDVDMLLLSARGYQTA